MRSLFRLPVFALAAAALAIVAIAVVSPHDAYILATPFAAVAACAIWPALKTWVAQVPRSMDFGAIGISVRSALLSVLASIRLRAAARRHRPEIQPFWRMCSST